MFSMSLMCNWHCILGQRSKVKVINYEAPESSDTKFTVNTWRIDIQLYGTIVAIGV